MDYKQSGVDIVAGEQAVKSIKDVVKKSYNKNVLTELGSFGGLYELDLATWKKPVIVSSTDGVGTKLIVAKYAGRYDTVGQCLVNHCVNDIFVQGGIPQFFMDYIGVGKMAPSVIKDIVSGMTTACIENGMSLIGGEMAEMPGIYQDEDVDIVGTIIGLVEKDKIITGSAIQSNDVVVGFPSTGLHTNGYSLARKIIFEKLGHDIHDFIPDIGTTVAQALLSIHRSYYPTLKKWASPDMIHGMAHITGGGLLGNIKRVLPAGLIADIDYTSFEVPPLFRWLIEKGEVPLDDAFRTFNMGIGYVVITDEKYANEIVKETDAIAIGKVKHH